MVFAPTPQIDNLFDQKPYTPALANDLSSFTQVFIYTLLRQRDLAGVITYAESVLYRNMFETDARQLRTNRAKQTYDARACIGWLKRDRMMRKGPDPWEIDGEETRERLGDMVSVMQWLRALLRVHELQAFRYRWPGSAEPDEGDPGKAAGEYAHYMGEFCEIGEDYEEVQARRRVALEERGRARVREAERREAEQKAAEARARG